MKKNDRMKFFAALLWFALAASASAGQPMRNANVTTVSDTTIFLQGTFDACHASTIVELSPGTLMASWFAGSAEGANDVGIWISTFRDGTWSRPIEAATGSDLHGKRVPCWNPVLFKTAHDTLYIFYKVGVNPREWRGMVMRSADDGGHWSTPEALPDGMLGPIKNKPMQCADGTILCPSSVESMDAKKWTVHLEMTDATLSVWKRVAIDADDSVGVIQPSILRHTNGRLQMLCRSRQNMIYQTWSEDDGAHWERLRPTSLPNPNSGIDAAALGDGTFVLVYNPLLHGADWFNGRNVLTVAVSSDGETWKDVYELERDRDGEYSYPAVIAGSDGSIHITYTARRKTIRHVVLRMNGK